MKNYILLSISLVMAVLPWACGNNSNPSNPYGAPTATYTPIPLTPTNTPTGSATPTNSPTRTPSATATNSSTGTPTSTPTATATNSPTPTVTNTPTITSTATDSPTNTPTSTPTNSPTVTPTSTPTSTATNSPTPTITNTPPPVSAVFSVYSPSLGTYFYSTSGTSGPAISSPITITAGTAVVWDSSNGGIHPLYLDNSSSCLINNQGAGFPTTVVLPTGTYRFHCGFHGNCNGGTTNGTCVNGSCTGLAGTVVAQ